MRTKFIYIAVLLLTLTVNAQSLPDYLSIAAQNNPELQSIQYQYESALEKVVEVGGLPNTTISVGYFVQPVETRVGAQKAKISATQKLPWFGTLGVKKESATYKAAAQLNTYDFAKRKLFLDIKSAYFELYELKATEKIILQNIDILITFESLALNELENNRSTMVDVLKIRMEKNELFNQLNAVQENFKAKQIGFNLLLNVSEEIEITVIESITINEFETFEKDSISNNPKMLQLDNLKSSLEKSELATKKEGLPTISIGLDYGFVQNRDIPDLEDNGQDIIMPMVSVSFPLFSKKYSSKQKQLRLEQNAIETTKVKTSNQLITLFEKAMASLKNAKVSIKTQEDNIDQADQAQKVLLAAYQTSKMDFEQILEVQQLKLKFQLKMVASEKKYAIQKSTIEFLVKSN